MKSYSNLVALSSLILVFFILVNPTQYTLYTPLHLAALYGYPELVALLCKHGANVHARNASLETPLQMASRSGIRIRERLKVNTEREGYF